MLLFNYYDIFELCGVLACLVLRRGTTSNLRGIFMKNIFLLLVLFMFMITPAGAEEVIKSLSGSETVTVGPLTVPENWEIHWETKGQYLQILVNSAESVPLHFAVEQIGPGKGVSKQEKGGDYILDINASGEWKVKIVDPK